MWARTSQQNPLNSIIRHSKPAPHRLTPGPVPRFGFRDHSVTIGSVLAAPDQQPAVRPLQRQPSPVAASAS